MTGGTDACTGGDGGSGALSWEQLLTGPAGAGGVRAISARHARSGVTEMGEFSFGLPLDDGMGWGEAITWTAAAAGAALVAARYVGDLLR